MSRILHMPFFVLALVLVPYVTGQALPSYVISTLAGSGPANSSQGSFGGDGGLATNALLNLPTSVALSRSSDLYFCDWNARIRKINLQTGLVTTVAGTGVWGFSGDGGPALAAKLGGSGAIALDNFGNIYFADPYNARIRRISTPGFITTVAGTGAQFDRGENGPAASIDIGVPSGIATDAKSNVYFSNGSDRVRKINVATGVLTTVAGAGGSNYSGDGGPALQAQLDQPSAVTLDAEGNLYIADRGEHRVRKVNGSNGTISTIAGASFGSGSGVFGFVTYLGGFSGDGGPATSAILNDPDGIAVDAAGNVYISDTLNYRIRRIDAITGAIQTIAGTGVKGFSGDGGSALNAQITTPSVLVADPAGHVYFADLFNQRIRILSAFGVRGAGVRAGAHPCRGRDACRDR